MRGAIPPLSNPFLWRAAQLNTWTTLLFFTTDAEIPPKRVLTSSVNKGHGSVQYRTVRRNKNTVKAVRGCIQIFPD
jgi:hypothetical protein